MKLFCTATPKQVLNLRKRKEKEKKKALKTMTIHSNRTWQTNHTPLFCLTKQGWFSMYTWNWNNTMNKDKIRGLPLRSQETNMHDHLHQERSMTPVQASNFFIWGWEGRGGGGGAKDFEVPVFPKTSTDAFWGIPVNVLGVSQTEMLQFWFSQEEHFFYAFWEITAEVSSTCTSKNVIVLVFSRISLTLLSPA